jgi:hypothetical protein
MAACFSKCLKHKNTKAVIPRLRLVKCEIYAVTGDDHGVQVASNKRTQLSLLTQVTWKCFDEHDINQCQNLIHIFFNCLDGSDKHDD